MSGLVGDYWSDDVTSVAVLASVCACVVSVWCDAEGVCVVVCEVSVSVLDDVDVSVPVGSVEVSVGNSVVVCDCSGCVAVCVLGYVPVRCNSVVAEEVSGDVLVSVVVSALLSVVTLYVLAEVRADVVLWVSVVGCLCSVGIVSVCVSVTDFVYCEVSWSEAAWSDVEVCVADL